MNQTKLNEILNQPFSSERTYLIEKNYETNKSLLAENNDLINLQMNLGSFLEKYRDSLEKWANESGETDQEIAPYLDDDELFNMTIKGKISYGKDHPKFGDDAFFNKLLSYYASIEAYEICNSILSQRYNPL